MGAYYHVGNVGSLVVVRFVDQDGESIDISTASPLRIHFLKPNGLRVERTASLNTTGADGRAKYATIAGDLDVAGIWQGEGYATIGAATWTTDPFTFAVVGNLQAVAPGAYCSPHDVVLRIGQNGLDQRTDDIQFAVADVIFEASSTIDLYLVKLYSREEIAGSPWTRFCCRALAVYYACIRRNEPAPASAEAEYKHYMELLQALSEGTIKLPDAAQAPGGMRVSNQRYDLQRYPAIRVLRPQSTKGTGPSPRWTDPGADWAQRG